MITPLRGRYAVIAIGMAGLMPAIFAQGRGGARQGNGAARAEAVEEGIQVTDTVTIAKCGSCHAKDDKGNLSRISWIRTTPEGWEEAIKRMVRLNGLQIEPADAKAIVKYLAGSHGLAPEEARPVMYIAEHRIQDEAIPNDSIKATCNNCHALGRAFSWRRTRAEWSLLADLHSALYPQADAAFRRNGAGGGGEGGQAPQPANVSLDITLDFLGKEYGLHTPAWSAWRSRLRTPRMAGKWLISAHVPGRGRYYGELTITPGAAPDEFKTSARLQPVKGGAPVVREGTSVLFGGYAWRGRSKGAAAVMAPDDLQSEMRETLWFSPDQTSAEGRWFWGEYQEFGVDVKLERATSEPALITLDSYSLKAGINGQRVRLIGDKLPLQIAAADLDFGAGVKVSSIASHTATEIVALVDVAADALPGKRDVALGGSVLEKAIAVYDRIDYIKVLPEAAMARLGGDSKSPHPRGYEQLEAIGYNRGEDGKPRTADDFEIGPIDVTWSIEEFFSVFGDDDKEFVGSLSNTGLFTPALDGPNPQRKFSRNNYGDVWAVATAKNEKDNDGKPLSGRSYLVVTVPTYIRWDQPEVTK